MIFAVLAAWMAYKKAKATNRNAILWAFIAVGVFIGTQLIVSLGIGFALGIAIGAFGWSQTNYEAYNILITIIAVILSLGATWLVLRYLDEVPEAETFTAPPPPPKFDKENEIS